MSTQHFKIACKTPAHHWDEDLLGELTLKQLTCLKKIMGFHCGSSKQGIIDYLLIASRIRHEFSAYWKDWQSKDHETQQQILSNVSKDYKGKVLKEKCRSLRIYCPSTKYGMVGAVISWALRANGDGQKFINDQRAFRATRPKQLSLPIAV